MPMTSLKPYMGIKVDLEKAYDRVKWKFIIAVFRWLKFPKAFVNWMKGCLKGASSSLCINGELSQPFLL